MTRQRRRLVYLAAGMAGLAAAGWAYLGARDPVEYKTVKADRGNIESVISATGNLNAVVTVQVGSQVSGNIKELYADFNTRVKKGQLVARIDPESFEARVNQARANLDYSKSAVINAQAGLQRAQAEVANARAAVESAKANVAKAKVAVLDAQSKLQRRVELYKQGVSSVEDRDTAQAAYDSSVAMLDAAKAEQQAAEFGLAAAQAQVEVARTQVAAAEAQVKQTSAALKQAEVDLEHTYIRAPVDGIVIARRMDVGQTVAASFQAPTLFEIAQDLTKMQVHTSVDEADIGRVRLGQTATFTVDAYPGKVFRGSVSEIRQAPISVQNVVTYDVVVAVANPDFKLFPGMTANERILVDRREEALRIPNAALRFRPPGAQGDAAVPGGGLQRVMAAGGPRPGAGGPGARGGGRRAPDAQTVYVLDAKGKPQPVKVKLGISDGTYTEVLSGNLKDGDPIVTAAGGKAAAQTASNGPPFGRRMGF